MDTVNVKVTSPRLVELPTAPGQRRPTRLVPGENDVPADVWEHAKGNPAVKLFLDAGVLEERSGKAKPLPTKATTREKTKAGGRRADDLSEFDVAQIETIVADTDDLALLGSWGDDAREEVQAMVRARLSELNKRKPRGRKRRAR